ncbi:hypothetical protein M011DRAFT_121018 [Sporormia fimetaria CBS 119925]|uniref:Heterokaryon incompatibility domain-containing protein n=1 Tax=Sporormia fimetaria CBS 119925 TaxID=1340428 RepID=A0A6A6V6W8_9PLEO|nr:hypothetical protein M011DRAFT_121018 [Sporormia fimetaria CBS 119925]
MVQVSSDVFVFGCPGLQLEEASAVLTLYESRLWIVQEAALAKRNMCFCGTLVFDLVEVTRAALWLRLHLRTSALPKLYESTRLPAVLNAYVDHAHGWYHGPPEHVPPEQIEHTYNTLATISRVNEATNPIDKLYGVLGLINHATGTKGIDIFPDYEKPIAWAFRAAAWSSIMSTSKLSILLLVYNRETDLENARPTQDADDEFPSWTPRLQRAWDPQCDPVPVLTDYQASSSITSSARSLNPREAGPYLTVDGICVGKVRARSGPILEPPSDGGYDIEDTLRQIFGMVDQFVSLARKERPPTTGGLALRELACAVVSGLDHNREQATDEWIEHAYSSLRSLLLRPGVNIPGLNDVTAETGPEAVLASQFFLAMGSTCLNRCLFALDPPSELQGTMGSIASGPTFTREGDIVAILYGYDWPAILRPVDDGSWQFVGPCYVYGIMRGEAVPVLRGSDYERIFVLC